MPNSMVITFISVYVLEAVFIIIGNLFAICVFLTQSLHQKRTCFLLISLAVADLLVGISEPIVLATGKFDKMTTLKGEEKIPPFSSALQLLASSTSLFSLALISLERAYAVLRPLRHRATNTRVYIYSIVIVWAVGLCMAGLFLLLTFYKEVDGRYFIFSIRICLLVAVLLTCANYFKIRNRLSSTSAARASHSNQSIEHDLRLSRTLFIVIALSLVFWLPAFVVYTVSDFCPQCVSSPVFWLVNALHLANSMVNPFVYTFRMPIFKDALSEFGRKWRQNAGVRRGLGLNSGNSCRSPNGTRQPRQVTQSTESNVEIQAVADDGFQLEAFQRK